MFRGICLCTALPEIRLPCTPGSCVGGPLGGTCVGLLVVAMMWQPGMGMVMYLAGDEPMPSCPHVLVNMARLEGTAHVQNSMYVAALTEDACGSEALASGVPRKCFCLIWHPLVQCFISWLQVKCVAAGMLLRCVAAVLLRWMVIDSA